MSKPLGLVRCLLCVCLLAACVNAAAADQGADSLVESESRPTQIWNSQQGFLFINGRYIPPPYEIASDSQSVSINGIDLATEGVEVKRNPDGPSDRPRRSFRRRSDREYTSDRQYGEDRQYGRDRQYSDDRQGTAPRRYGSDRTYAWGREGSYRSFESDSEYLPGVSEVAVDLHTHLQLKFSAVLMAGKPPLFLMPTREGYELIQILARDGERSIAGTEYLSAALANHGADQSAWQRWVNEFRPTEEFQNRAAPIVRAVDKTVDESEAIGLFAWWQTRMAYPLTVLGMILVVFAFGHLLSERPRHSLDRSGAGCTVEQERAIRRSLALVLAFSAMDLVWTILASQGGAMRELNPLGSGLIERPELLVLFKLAMTSLAVGLLYHLRRQPIAEQASWWSCLLLTLLTARWLTFNSMFVA